MPITDVAGIRVGHWSDPAALTGCTVVLLPADGAVAGVDVRGSAPGTRETDLLRPGNLVERVHAILLAGGSAFGLAAADGVMRYLAERGIGLQAGPARVPIVPAAVLFDLGRGSSSAHPGATEGYVACQDAERAIAPAEGRVGAGTGAWVGKLLGWERAVPGGLGSASVQLPGGARVGALAVVNALGDVVDSEGGLLAGVGAWDALLSGQASAPAEFAGNTTLGVLATDARLDKSGCRKLAELGHDALALAIRPVHTMHDGDTVFAVSTGRREVDPTVLGIGAVTAMRSAIERAVSRG